MLWLEGFGGVEGLVFYIFCAVTALCLVLALAILILGCAFKTSSPGASMDFYIAFGGLAVAVTVLLRGLDPKWGGATEMEIACQFFPSLLVFGLLWLIGGILLRVCTIYSVNQGSGSDKPRRFEWKPNLWMILLMIVDAVAVLVWILLFTPKINPDLELGMMHYCSGLHIDKWMIGMSAFHGFLLVMAAIMVWPAYAVSQRHPSGFEARMMAGLTYNLFFSVLAIVLVYFLYPTTTTLMYTITGGLALYGILITFILVIVTKIVVARREERGERSYNDFDKEGYSFDSRKREEFSPASTTMTDSSERELYPAPSPPRRWELQLQLE